MGFISAEAASAINERLGAPEPEETAPPAPVEVKTEAVAPETPEESVDSSKPAEDVKQEADSQEDKAGESFDDVDSGHRVPYKRFKSVLEARNEFRDRATGTTSENEKLRMQIEELQTRIASSPATSAPPEKIAPPSDDAGDWIDRLLAGDDTPQPQQAAVASPDGVLKHGLKDLEARLQNMELAAAETTLATEVKAAIEKYPVIEEGVLYQAIAQNPGTPAMTIAENYNTWRSEVEESAIAAYLKAQGDGKPQAAPRPKSSGSAGVIAPPPGEGPKTMDQARESLRAYLAKHNPFAS
jgi:hypothetical protein